jgi:hypothetical protein
MCILILEMSKQREYEKKKRCPCKYCKEYESDDECSEHSDHDHKYSEPKVINCKPNVIIRRPKIIKCEPTIIKYKPEIIKCHPKIIKWYEPEVTYCDTETKKIGCKPIVKCDKHHKNNYNNDDD